MNRLLRIFSAIALLLLAGCFQVDTVVRVNPDGSGTVVETMLLSKRMLAQLNEMMQGFAGEKGAKPEPIDLFEPAKLKDQAAKMGDGVSYLSGQKAETAEYSGYTATYAFKDINKLKINQKSAGPVGADEDEKTQSMPILFHFSKGSPAKLTIEMPGSKTALKNSEAQKEEVDTTKMDAETPKESAETPKTDSKTPRTNKSVISDGEAKKLMEMFMGMKMSLTLEVNGAIVETNATHRDGNRIAIVDLDLAKLGASIPQLEKLNLLKGSSIAEARELMKDFPGMKMDMNERLTVLFTK